MRLVIAALPIALSFAAACRATSAPPLDPASASASESSSRAAGARSPVALTYLGVAGWLIEAGGKVLLTDPYLSRIKLEGPVTPDPAAIAAHTPERADLIFIGHSHVDHLLDAPAIAKRTGAQLLGSKSTAWIARASGVPDNQILPVRGGEDYELGGYSIRVIPSLHSAIDNKHTFHSSIDAAPKLPMTAADYPEGGTLAYLVRVGGHQIFVLSTANFIEREIEGLRPDIAIVAVGLRDAIHDYTCRLMRALGNPPRVYPNHFDDWLAPPKSIDPEELRGFIEEVRRCSPNTEVIVPRHFERMTVN